MGEMQVSARLTISASPRPAVSIATLEKVGMYCFDKMSGPRIVALLRPSRVLQVYSTLVKMCRAPISSPVEPSKDASASNLEL
jgi:hypothetical protein